MGVFFGGSRRRSSRGRVEYFFAGFDMGDGCFFYGLDSWILFFYF